MRSRNRRNSSGIMRGKSSRSIMDDHHRGAVAPPAPPGGARRGPTPRWLVSLSFPWHHIEGVFDGGENQLVGLDGATGHQGASPPRVAAVGQRLDGELAN